MLGLSTNLTLKYIEKNRAKKLETIEKTALHKKAIEDFKKEVGNIKSAADLVQNYKVYSFAMKAFGLEDQIFGKAMMRKVFESDASDEKSLVNRLTDTKIKDMYNYFKFEEGGKNAPYVNDPDFVQGIVDRYLETTLENTEAEQNENVGVAMYAQRKLGSVKSWYNVLADTQLTEFFKTALVLPDNLAAMPIEKQKAMLEKKFDLEKLKDPKEVDKLMTRYGALADVKTSQANMSSGLTGSLSLFSNASNFITIDVSAISFSKIGKYSTYR